MVLYLVVNFILPSAYLSPLFFFYVFSLTRYTIWYNGNRIIRVVFQPDDLQPIVAGASLEFTYEVSNDAGTWGYAAI